MVYAPLDADPYVDGSVKWDGCANYSVGTEGCMMHACERDHIAKLGRVLVAIYDRCGRFLTESGKANTGAFKK